jgi:hypothetical protein
MTNQQSAAGRVYNLTYLDNKYAKLLVFMVAFLFVICIFKLNYVYSTFVGILGCKTVKVTDCSNFHFHFCHCAIRQISRSIVQWSFN